MKLWLVDSGPILWVPDTVAPIVEPPATNFESVRLYTIPAFFFFTKAREEIEYEAQKKRL